MSGSRAIAVYREMWLRQWRDRNAGARLTRFQRARRDLDAEKAMYDALNAFDAESSPSLPESPEA